MEVNKNYFFLEKEFFAVHKILKANKLTLICNVFLKNYYLYFIFREKDTHTISQKEDMQCTADKTHLAE